MSDRNPNRVSAYYADVTEHYLRYGEGFHYGLGTDAKESHQRRLLRSHEQLVSDLRIDPSWRVLDLGCGIGSFSVWCAKTFGCRVVGVNICEAHLALARQRALKQGVAARIEFIHADFNDLPFRGDAFDLAVNQESLCYARDKAAYFTQVHCILRPGGIYRAIAFMRGQDASCDRATLRYEKVCEGFHIPNLSDLPTLIAWLEAAGFCGVKGVDMTSDTLLTARFIARHCLIPIALGKLGLDALVFREGRRSQLNHRGHFAAGLAYSKGLIDGDFAHGFLSAQKSSVS